MNCITNVHTTPTVHDQGDVYTASGMRVPAAEVRARSIAEQAARWLAFATERTRMKPHTLTTKALASVAFSVHHGAAGFAVPSKLTGTSEHQPALWALVRNPAEPWAVLEVNATDRGLVASYDGDVLGLLQSKHLGWVRPLVPFGLTVHLSRVTGHDYEAYTLGCNVVFGRVGTALDRLLVALGRSGDAGGDGAPTGPVPAADVAPEPAVPHSDGAPQGAAQVAPMAPDAPAADGARPSSLRLVVRPEHEALTATDPGDVVLYRRIDGMAHATCDHVVRHSPTGFDWGPGSGRAGRADLALSVLTRVVGADIAETLYGPFADEVVARVLPRGGVLLAARVRAWVVAQASR